VDRVDSWLNRQVGWRRAVLAWLKVCPVMIMVAVPVWYVGTPGIQRPSLEFAAVAPWFLLAAVPLAGVSVRLQRDRPIGPMERPVFSWCTYAATLCWMAFVLLNVLTDWAVRPQYWRVSYVLLWAGVGFWIERERRFKRLSRGIQRWA
jgi:hypothetical protein